MSSRSVLTLVVMIAALAGCQRESQKIKEAAGEGEGEPDITSPCTGAALFVQTDKTNDTEAAPLVVDSADSDLVLFGDSPDNGKTFATLIGYFAIGGYKPNQHVVAQAVNTPCSNAGCPKTVGFRFFGTINLTNPNGACGETTLAADASGELLFRITGGGTGNGGGGGGGGNGDGTGAGTGGGGGTGPNGPDTGLRLTPQ